MQDKEHLDRLRHSAAHLLAAAVLELYPDAKPAIGPPTENGFYYDFGGLRVSDKDLSAIEKKMRELVKNWQSFERIDESTHRIKEIFKDNPYKLELIDELERENKKITLYKSGEFVDLCRGGHVENPSKELKHFKLLSVAGAYWRGDSKRDMLTRIYGAAFPASEELKTFLIQQEEAKKRDHRRLGRELDLFTFSDLVGAGLPIYTPKGALVRRLINEYVEGVQSKRGYHQVWTPQMAKGELFKISGHYDKYANDMFRVYSNYSDEEFFLKPMNCPQHSVLYASQKRSYRDLPVRYTDFAMLYRDERPGELLGLARTRAFSQDDSHIFCTEDQVDEEINNALEMTKEIMGKFGFKYRYAISTRDKNQPEKYLGDSKTWDKVEAWLERIMRRHKMEYVIEEGEAAFYAPKMDLIARDSLGREWQLSTIQIDYVMPKRFGLKYTDKDGVEKTPVKIHRAILGSAERFMMIILEHYAGAFPFWLAPIQVKILPITDRNIAYSREIVAQLKEKNVRVELVDKSETLSNKIRLAQKEKVPYMIIIGDKEEEENKISVRTRDGDDIGGIGVNDFIDKFCYNTSGD